mgnify:CR=1 FL=1
MRISRLRMAFLALSAIATCSLSGCFLMEPISGRTIQNGNDRIHFGGYAPQGERFYAEAWNFRTQRWERLRGQYAGYNGAVADGALALLTGFQPYLTLNDGSHWYDWRDRFFVTPDQWTGSQYNWRAAVRATDASGKQIVLRNASGSGDPALQYIWIYCNDPYLRTTQRGWWES